MCRLLAVKGKEFSISNYLQSFAEISKNSKEFQGHGWGCSYFLNGNWEHYKNITPIWEDDLKKFGSATLLVAHARSAFKDEGIVSENNMPFHDDKYVFIFNGELQGVQIKAEGRIGAEKIFNYIKRFDWNGGIKTEASGMLKALKKGVNIIKKRSRYVRAMNIIIADQEKIYLSTNFNEDEDYHTLHYKYLKDGNEQKGFVISSVPFEEGWQKIKNNTTREFK